MTFQIKIFFWKKSDFKDFFISFHFLDDLGDGFGWNFCDVNGDVNDWVVLVISVDGVVVNDVVVDGVVVDGVVVDGVVVDGVVVDGVGLVFFAIFHNLLVLNATQLGL